MDRVYILLHTHELPDGREDYKLIGVYSSLEKAKRARERIGLEPGFKDNTIGFTIDEYQLDQDYWQEGFITVE